MITYQKASSIALDYFEQKHQKSCELELDKLFEEARTSDWILAILHSRSFSNLTIAYRLAEDSLLVERLREVRL